MALDFAAAYDELNPADHDHRFYAALAARLGATSVLDPHRALVPGGTLAFESRNPSARAWERWTRDATLRTVDTPGGPVEFWHETAEVTLPLVAYDTFTRDVRTGEQTSTRDVLAFRDAETLRRSLEAAGFRLSLSYGDWDGKPEAAITPEIILVAQTAVCTSTRLY